MDINGGLKVELTFWEDEKSVWMGVAQETEPYFTCFDNSVVVK